MRIFCVEDDDDIRALEVYTLQAAGYDASGFADAEAFYAALAGAHPDLVLLDVMLPGEDGLSVLRRLRGNPATAAVPVILATARGAEYDKVAGLDAGADDYIAKPFGMMEMTAHVRAVLRRAAPRPQAHTLRAGAIEMDTEGHTVWVEGVRVELALKEYELLRTLMENPAVVLTRDRLLQEIWDTDYDGETRTVDVHIRTLRRKLGQAGQQVETVRGVGYRMGAGV